MSHTTADLPNLSLPPQDDDIRRALADVEARLSAWTAAMTAAHATLVSLPHASVAEPAAKDEPQPAPEAQPSEESDSPDRSGQQTSEGNDSPDRSGQQTRQTESQNAGPAETIPEASETKTESAPNASNEHPSIDAPPNAPKGRQSVAGGVSPRSAAQHKADKPPTGATEARISHETPPIPADDVATDTPPSSPAPPAEHPTPHRPTTGRRKANAPNRSSEHEDEALLATLDSETAKAIRIMRRLSFEKKSVRELLEEYNAAQAGPTPVDNRKKSWWSRG